MAAQRKPASGAVIYRGPSQINGEPIVAIAIYHSKNVKTGNVVQTYIIPDNENNPQQNSKLMLDASVCGDCPLRQNTGGGCYVLLWQGPSYIHKAFRRGSYPDKLDDRLIHGRTVRLGSYGDPAAVPERSWDRLLIHAAVAVGYTHQWRNPDNMWLAKYCMASVESLQDRDLAKSLGYRTFRVMHEGDRPVKGEVRCPSDRIVCDHCRRCTGMTLWKGQTDIVVVAHGAMRGRIK